MIVTRKLRCVRSGRTVLECLDLRLAAGEVLGVLGANGAGKTSLLCTLSGELRAGEGEVVFDGQDLRTMRQAALARRRAVLPQSSSLAFDLDVSTVVGMGAYPFPELSPAGLDALVARALALADAGGLRARRYAALSGGEQQRVHLARVLVQVLASRGDAEFRALFLDEPTASLDPLHQHLVLQAVSGLAREERIAVFVVLHDVNLAATWCDRLLLLARGRAVAQGAPREVLTPHHLQAVYGLSARVIDHPEDAARALVLFDAATARAA